MRSVLVAAVLAASMMLAGCAAPDDVGAASVAPETLTASSEVSVPPVDEAGEALAPFVVDAQAVGDYQSVGVPGAPTVHYSVDLPGGFFVAEHTCFLQVAFEFSGSADLNGSPKAGYATATLEAPDGTRHYPSSAVFLPETGEYKTFLTVPPSDTVVFEFDDPLPGEWVIRPYANGAASYVVTASLHMEGFGEPPKLPGWDRLES